MSWSPKHWISLKTTVYCPIQITMFSTVLINQALLLNFFVKISIYLCCPWSEVRMILAFHPHPISLILVICLDLPITRTVMDFPWRFKLSRVYCTIKSMVYCAHLPHLVSAGWLYEEPTMKNKPGASFEPIMQKRRNIWMNILLFYRYIYLGATYWWHCNGNED